jgi:hypothetical protein
MTNQKLPQPHPSLVAFAAEYLTGRKPSIASVMAEPLNPEQVAKLKLPSWFQLVPISEYQGDLTFEVLCKDKWQGQVTEEGKESSFGAPRSEVILAYLAENIANGHLPPEALDAVWAIMEGRCSYYLRRRGELEPCEKEHAECLVMELPT